MTLGVALEARTDLLIRALRAFDGVVSEPGRFGPVAVGLVEESRGSANPSALVVALRARAWFERSLQRNVDARRTLDEAVTVARRQGLPARLGEALVSRAAVNLELGRTDAAWRDLRTAAAQGPASPEVDYMRAVVLQNLGRLAAAADAYRLVLAHPDTPPDRRGGAANNLALIDAAHGRYADGLRRLDDVLHAVEGPDGRSQALRAYATHNRSLILAQSGRLAESVRTFADAVDRLAAAGLPLGEFQAEHAETLADLRLLPEARAMAGRAATELDAHQVPLMAAEARLTLARVALRSGDWQAAVESAVDAGARFRGQRRSAWAARATTVEAEASLLGGTGTADLLARTRRGAGVLRRAGLTSAAIGAYLVAGRIAEDLDRPAVARRSFVAGAALPRTGPVVTRLESRLAAARAQRLAGDDAGVLRHCRAGLSDLARHRAALGSTELRALASGHGVDLGLLGLQTLLRIGRPSRLLEWMERTRAAALLTVHRPATEQHRESLAELGAAYADLALARRESGTEPADLLARLTDVEQRIRRHTWTEPGTGGGAAGMVSPAEVRALLGDDALAFYGSDGDRLFALMIRNGRCRMVELAAASTVRFETDALLFALRRLTRPGPAAAVAAARSSAEQSLVRLRALLIEPLRVPPDTPLVVVPGAGTLRLPWSALHPAPVSVTPSMSLWARARRRRAPARRGGVVAVAGPGLTGAVPEVRAVAACHPGAAVVATPDATVPAVVEALAGADLAHLACHGRLRIDNPMFSALELDGGELTLHELDVRGIAPRRVVLASCDSAAEVSYDGDELLGFVSALLARGTAGIVASVVLVGDAEAVDLMTDLHRHVASGASMAQSLHRARAAVDRSDPRAFVNWCAFTAFGAA